MPIYGKSNAVYRLPRRGIIRIGEKIKKNGKEYPRALDHFVGPEEFHTLFGKEPKSIDIRFPFSFKDFAKDDFSPAFTEDLKAYKGGGKLFCKGNGRIAERSDGKGDRVEIECLHKDCPYFRNDECKEIGSLSFEIREITVGSVFQLTTNSSSSSLNIRSTLKYYYDLYLKHKDVGFPDLDDVPFVLTVKMQKVNPWVGRDGEKKQVSTQVPIIYLECNLPYSKIKELENRHIVKNKYELSEGAKDDSVLDKDDTLYVNSKLNEVQPDDIVNDSLNSSVAKFMNYCQYLEMEELCKEPIVEFMSVTDKKGEIRCPTNDQILKWESENEIAFVNKAIEKMELKFPILLENFKQ